MTVTISPNIENSNSKLCDFRRLSFLREGAFRPNVTLGQAVNCSKFYLPFLPAVHSKLYSYVDGERLQIMTSSGRQVVARAKLSFNVVEKRKTKIEV